MHLKVHVLYIAILFIVPWHTRSGPTSGARLTASCRISGLTASFVAIRKVHSTLNNVNIGSERVCRSMLGLFDEPVSREERQLS